MYKSACLNANDTRGNSKITTVCEGVQCLSTLTDLRAKFQSFVTDTSVLCAPWTAEFPGLLLQGVF